MRGAGVLREVTTHFSVDARALDRPVGVKVVISNPSGATDAYVTDKGDGTFRVEYTTYEDGEDPAHWRLLDTHIYWIHIP